MDKNNSEEKLRKKIRELTKRIVGSGYTEMISEPWIEQHGDLTIFHAAKYSTVENDTENDEFSNCT